MALRTKPQQKPVSEDDRRINALIEKGGTIATGHDETKLMLVQLRLAPEVVRRIDTTRSKRKVPPSRHSWILEALLDKLERDE